MADFTAPWVIFERLYTELPADAAFWFLVLTAPICAYAAWYDMAELKIKNELVLLLFAIFVIAGPILLPFDMFLVQILQAFLVLVVTFAMNMLGVMGGGDSKFIAAAAPYVMREDWRLIVLISCACLLGGVIVHRLTRVLGGAKFMPGWKSWTSGDRYPAALSLSAILVAYLAIAAF